MRFPSLLYRLRRRLGLRRAEFAVIPAACSGSPETESVLLVFGEGDEDGRSFRTFGPANVVRFLSKLAYAEGGLNVTVPAPDYRSPPVELFVPSWAIRKVAARARNVLAARALREESFAAEESTTSTVSTESCRFPYPVPRP